MLQSESLEEGRVVVRGGGGASGGRGPPGGGGRRRGQRRHGGSMNNAERQSIYPPHAKPRALSQKGKTSGEKIKHMIFSSYISTDIGG